MVINNHLKIDKVTLVSWVDKTLDQSCLNKTHSMGLGQQGFGH